MNFDRMKAFQEELTSWRIPGNDCMINKDGKNIYRYQSGWADIDNRKPIGDDDLYFFYSASKVITTSLALKLHEEGKFCMSDPLSEYMPEFKDMTVRKEIDGKEEIVPAEKKIQIGQLFNMTAGFNYNLDTEAIREMKKATNGHCPTRDALRAIAKTPLCFEPGEHWEYSLCHDVLGGLIEVITGKRLRDYAKEVLFDPLGMNDTTYNLPSSDKMDRFASQYYYDDLHDKLCKIKNECIFILGDEYDSGGAGVITTTSDYMKFANTIVNWGTSPDGYRFISPATIKLWRTNTLTAEQLKDIKPIHRQGYGYGYGVRTMMNPHPTGALSPVGEFGWDGAAGVWVILDPDNRLALVYVQHLMNNQSEYIFPRLRNILYSSLD